MEAQTNVTAFSVLRTLDSKGELRFDLSCVSFHALDVNLFSSLSSHSSVVEELIKVAGVLLSLI